MELRWVHGPQDRNQTWSQSSLAEKSEDILHKHTTLSQITFPQFFDRYFIEVISFVSDPLGHVYRSLGIPGLVRCALHTTLGQVPSGLALGLGRVMPLCDTAV